MERWKSAGNSGTRHGQGAIPFGGNVQNNAGRRGAAPSHGKQPSRKAPARNMPSHDDQMVSQAEAAANILQREHAARYGAVHQSNGVQDEFSNRLALPYEQHSPVAENRVPEQYHPSLDSPMNYPQQSAYNSMPGNQMDSNGRSGPHAPFVAPFAGQGRMLTTPVQVCLQCGRLNVPHLLSLLPSV